MICLNGLVEATLWSSQAIRLRGLRRLQLRGILFGGISAATAEVSGACGGSAAGGGGLDALRRRFLRGRRAAVISELGYRAG